MPRSGRVQVRDRLRQPDLGGAGARGCCAARGVGVCSVVGFPLGATTPDVKHYETRRAIFDGAREIDMVINVGALKSGDLRTGRARHRGGRPRRAATAARVSKVIIEAALLTDEEKVTACTLAKAAGADFVKTSTGFGPGGATAADVALMRRVVGAEMGVKAAGGVRDLERTEGDGRGRRHARRRQRRRQHRPANRAARPSAPRRPATEPWCGDGRPAGDDRTPADPAEHDSVPVPDLRPRRVGAAARQHAADAVRDDLTALRGLNDVLSMDEVVEIYLPLSRLLNLYVRRRRRRCTGRTQTFLGNDGEKVPFIIGLAGSVAVGKSTTARILQALLARWPDHPRVDLVTTDGFLLPNAVLESRGLMQRKGFPESYDRGRLCASSPTSSPASPEVQAPVYSHQSLRHRPGRGADACGSPTSSSSRA